MNNILSLCTNCANVYSSSSQIFLFAELERSITPFTMKRTVTNSRFYRMLILVKRNFLMLVQLTLVFSQSALPTKSFIIRNIRISVAFHHHILIFYNKPDWCREESGMSNLRNILVRTSEAFRNTTVVCEENKIDMLGMG